jgi:hypothetical protein
MLRLFRHFVSIFYFQQLRSHLNIIVFSSAVDGVLNRAGKGASKSTLQSQCCQHCIKHTISNLLRPIATLRYLSSQSARRRFFTQRSRLPVTIRKLCLLCLSFNLPTTSAASPSPELPGHIFSLHERSCMLVMRDELSEVTVQSVAIGYRSTKLLHHYINRNSVSHATENFHSCETK